MVFFSWHTAISFAADAMLFSSFLNVSSRCFITCLKYCSCRENISANDSFDAPLADGVTGPVSGDLKRDAPGVDAALVPPKPDSRAPPPSADAEGVTDDGSADDSPTLVRSSTDVTGVCVTLKPELRAGASGERVCDQ